ncbi:unnamed protein product [Cylicocyclus nassatus]|uniref:Tudor domain-containing protein n=1 Tax=Cylicocyclus nassatus TaxID=53992 RepID=A0AA36DM30_CYLNA|nr:unnamed protein product [Cylicocyclus nassatus]
MYRSVIARNDSAPSTFTVKGLPPLEVKIGREGYFDGFISSAQGVGEMWLISSFDERNAIVAATSLFQPRPLKSIQRGTLAVIGLQYGNSPKTWTRVIVEGRPDPTHAKVYLVDYGMRQLVNARSLYEMPIEMMRVPPQAFPVIPKISQPPDLGPGEWQKLKNVRITVHMRGVKDGKFVCDQMTVYDASTRTDVDFGAALRSNIQLELANVTLPPSVTAEKSFLLAPESRIDLRNAAGLPMRLEHRDFSVVLVCVFGILMVVASIMIVIGFTYKRIQVDRERRRRRHGAPADYPNPDAIPSWPNGNDNLQPQVASMPPISLPPDTTEAATAENTKAVENMTTKPPCDDRKEISVLVLSEQAIAAIAALMGISSAMADREFSRTIAIPSEKEKSVDDMSRSIPARLGAGTSEISSIRASSSEDIPAFLTSTPMQISSQESPKQERTAEGSSSHDSSSLGDEFTKAITTYDVQRILKERAIVRYHYPKELNSTSLSSFYSAAST